MKSADSLQQDAAAHANAATPATDGNGEPSVSTPSARRRRTALGKKVLFSFIVTAFLLGVLETLLFLFGVQPVFYEEDPYVGFAAGSPLFTRSALDDGTIVYKTSPNKLAWFNSQSFPAVKDADTFRIFCLGGSTTAGRPYDDKTSFSRWLREFMTAADPDRKWEVVNAGGVSYASYRVARLMNELVRYEPDLFIVYTGHNEFLERHTYASIQDTPVVIRNLTALLSHTRVYSVARRFVGSTMNAPAQRAGKGKSILPSEVDAILDRTLENGPESYSRDDVFRSQVVSHFTNTLHRIVDIARHAGADVIFVEPASNLRDCRPFKSQHRDGLSENELTRWERLVTQGRNAVKANQLQTALASFDDALRIDDRVASLHFERAAVLWKMERFDDAKLAFTKARDEDICPLRALTSMRQSVKDVARQRHARLIPFATVVEERSPHGVPGAETFLDHVHPTIAGHQLLATLILDELKDMGVIHPRPEWTESAQRAVITRVESEFDPKDHAAALRNLAKVLTWAGKYEDGDRLALQAVVDLPDDYEAQYLAGNAEMRRQHHREAIAFFERTVQLNPSHTWAYNNLGNEYFQLGELKKAAEAFEESVRVDPQFAQGYHNLGVVHFNLGNLRLAVENLNKALQIEPGYFDAYYTLSKIYVQRKRYVDAKRCLEQALAIQPNHAGVRRDMESLRSLIP